MSTTTKTPILKELIIDHRTYKVEIYPCTSKPLDAPRLAIVSYQPNDQAKELLRVCIDAIQKTTSNPYELWIIDNNSPLDNCRWLLEIKDVNVVFNRTDPMLSRVQGLIKYITTKFNFKYKHPVEASYANAIALELALQLIHPDTKYFMALHMDTMPCHTNWLIFLQSKIDQGYAGAGARIDKTRTPEGVLHVLGLMVNFPLFTSLNLNFLPSLPEFDTGDRVTVAFRNSGYKIYACRNTLWEPDLIKCIPLLSPMRKFQVDRAFDDKGNVIFLHLGRGIRKSSGKHIEGITTKEWIEFANNHIIN